ncbi:Pyruvate/Phosphoenolpyruvate kinase-like domain containing protein [Amanita muscaria]
MFPIRTSRSFSTLRRSYLYVPATSDRMLDKSLVSNSDVIIYDLEDSVPPSPVDKVNARLRLSNFLFQKLTPNVERNAVRINDVTTPFFRDDIHQIAASASIRAVVVPKVHSPSDLDAVSRELHQAFKVSPREAPIRIIPSIESAKAMWNLNNIVTWKSKYGGLSGGVISALLFAAEDYCADTSIIRTPSRRELLYTRSEIVVTAKAFGLEAIDMVCINYRDLDVLQDECRDGRQLGFTGKQAIHPNQVQTIQSTFVPTTQEIDRAAKIVHAMKLAHSSQKGAVGLDGFMIDAPMIKQAEKILQAAEAAGVEIPAL